MEHEELAFLYVEVMWRKSDRSELSFGSSLVRVGLLVAENICYLSHYYIVSYYCIII